MARLILYMALICWAPAKPVSEDYYYRMLVLPIHKSYPVYALGRAPAGYMEKLKQLKPEIAFNRAKLKTKQGFDQASSCSTRRLAWNGCFHGTRRRSGLVRRHTARFRGFNM